MRSVGLLDLVFGQELSYRYLLVDGEAVEDEMPNYFQKPENALKRAKEFIDIGKKASGLEVLNDIIRSKKHRQWSKTHESIMLLFTELCVELQRSSFAKDGLYQYRNICKDVALNSFEVVVKAFLALAKEKASAAREESEQATLVEIEDLDYIQTPESLLLSTVSGEGTKERTDRVVLTPWVKFLWESYRNMLELLKNNHTVERVYADIAKDAFQFCLKYQRRTEFRKLCDILRNHLVQAQRYQNQTYSLKFDNPETIQFLVDVRFEQLECSITVDLWQEAFKAIEEIHNLLGISGKAPKPGLLDNFYAKQAKVYWMASNHLFHAAALHKLFVLRKEQRKTLTHEEAQKTASQVLLATLAIPIAPVPSETDRFLEVDDTGRDKARRLASLLRMSSPPSRASLMKDLLRYGCLQYILPELQELHCCLEEEFDPLNLCKRVLPILEGIQEHQLFGQYVQPLKEITLVRLIKQVSQVYESIELSRLAELAPFTTPTNLEKVVVKTACSNGIQVRIDHHTKSFRFGADLTFHHKDEAPEGPYIQAMPSEGLCGQLTLMSQALQQAVRIISSKEMQLEHTQLARKAAVAYQQHSRQDHKAAMHRKTLIEARKEYIENQSKAKEHKEVSERRQREQQERTAEQERLKREAGEREQARVQKEMKELQKRKAQDRLEDLKKTAVGARALADISVEDLDELDADDIVAKQLKQMEKERREKETKLKTQERKVDYFERAKRLVEVPILRDQYQQQIDDDRLFHEEQEEERVTTAIKERKEAESAKSRLSLMARDKDVFIKQFKEDRQKQHQEKLVEFEAHLAELRTERLQKRKLERRQKRKAEAQAAQKAEEEQLARKRSEEEQRQREEERQQRDSQLEEQRLKQLQREQEIEEKMRRKDEEQRQQMDDKRREAEREDEKTRQPPSESDSWRRREQDDEDWHDTTPRRWERAPPDRRDEHDRYPARGTYRPPVAREDEGNWRTSSRDEPDHHGPPPGGRDRDRDGYGGPRGGRKEYDDYGGRRERGDDFGRGGRDDYGHGRRDDYGHGRRDDYGHGGRDDDYRRRERGDNYGGGGGGRWQRDEDHGRGGRERDDDYGRGGGRRDDYSRGGRREGDDYRGGGGGRWQRDDDYSPRGGRRDYDDRGGRRDYDDRGGRREREGEGSWRRPQADREREWRGERDRDGERDTRGPPPARGGREDDQGYRRGDAERDSWRRDDHGAGGGWRERDRERPRGTGGRGREPSPGPKSHDKEVDEEGFELVKRR